jgi:hypothetical protein
MSNRIALASGSALALTAWLAGCSSASHPTTMADGVEQPTDAGTVPPGCPSNTGYPGDNMCLAAPPPDQGFQLHYGATSYGPDSAADVDQFVLQPGDETVDCWFEPTPNTQDVYVGGYEFSLRPGSHHLNVNINSSASPTGFGTCQANDNAPGLLGGTETPFVDERVDPAPENQGLAVHLPANSEAVINFHVIDTGNEPIVREAWLNYFYIDQSQVKGLRGNVFLTGGIGFYIMPGTHQTFDYSCSPDRPVRILSLAAHMHVHSQRMTAWKVSSVDGGPPTPALIYETYSWGAPTFVKYDSAHPDNPVPDRATQTPGGSSGTLIINPTDTIQWECDVDNTSDDILTFKNEVFTGEMCILTGAMVPADNPMNEDNFTCTLN